MATASKTLPDHWKILNCCSCRRLLSGLACAASLTLMSGKVRRSYPPLVAGRILGRPYCAACLETARQAGHALDAPEPDAAQEGAVRAMEDTGGGT